MKKIKTFLVDLIDAIKEEINKSKFKLVIIIVSCVVAGLLLYVQYKVMIAHPWIVASSIFTYIAITNFHKIKRLYKS